MREVLILGVLCIGIAACDRGEPQATPLTSIQPEVPAAERTAPLMVPNMPVRTVRMWAGSCALCHVDGNAMAPRVGHAEEWLPRLAKGKDVLLQHTLEGFNDMPPLGYCMACEMEDFVAMIDFMTAGIEGEI